MSGKREAFKFFIIIHISNNSESAFRLSHTQTPLEPFNSHILLRRLFSLSLSLPQNCAQLDNIFRHFHNKTITFYINNKKTFSSPHPSLTPSTTATTATANSELGRDKSQIVMNINFCSCLSFSLIRRLFFSSFSGELLPFFVFYAYIHTKQRAQEPRILIFKLHFELRRHFSAHLIFSRRAVAAAISANAKLKVERASNDN